MEKERKERFKTYGKFSSGGWKSMKKVKQCLVAINLK